MWFGVIRCKFVGFRVVGVGGKTAFEFIDPTIGWRLIRLFFAFQLHYFHAIPFCMLSLSSDRAQTVGHAICIDSNTVGHARELLSREPILQVLTCSDAVDLTDPIFRIPPTDDDEVAEPSPLPPADLSKVKLFRWRHIKDHTSRQDDGLGEMTPTLILSLDRMNQEELRAATNRSHVEYLIDSERIVMAGPLHVCTEKKDDPKSAAVGNLMIVNAHDRDHAIEFAENDPCALSGLYDKIRVHDFNTLDISGKFVMRNKFNPDERDIVKDAMEAWGYPVEDSQTQWING